MIISHRYKFIFVKTKKTAGTSIEVMLSGVCGDDDVLTPVEPPVDGHRARNHSGCFNPIPELIERSGGRYDATIRDLKMSRRYYNHIPAYLVRARTRAKTWKDYFKFCVERNPWDKTVSHYQMLRNDPSVAWMGAPQTLEQYFKNGVLCHNLQYYTDYKRDNIIVDRVLKYENLDRELGEVCSMLGIPYGGSIGVRAKGEHRKVSTSYREMFTGEQRRIVEQRFAREIEIHGYEY